MDIKPLLEKRRRTVQEMTGQLKQTSWKVIFKSFLIYTFSFFIGLGIISVIFGFFHVKIIWLQIVLALIIANIIGKKIAVYVEGIKKEDGKEITYQAS